MLEIDSLSVSYGQVEVLHSISLSVAEGEFVALVGSNNAGKSTLLLTISGLLNPTKGTIRFLGKPMNGLAPHQRVADGIIQVPERKRLFPRMTVEENLLVGGSNARAIGERPQMVQRMYETFPVLGQRRKQEAQTLSGGEQQMLAIARGMMAKPKLLILDEPSLGLAPRIVGDIYKTLVALNAEGLSVLLSEQNARISLQSSRRAYVIQEGRIVLTGDSASLANSDEVRQSYLGL